MTLPVQRRHIPRSGWLLSALTVLAVLLCVGPTWAQVGSARYSSIIVNAATGEVLGAANPDAERHPASLVKMMTLYMAFEALRDRRIALDQYVPVSAYAASMEPTKLGLLPGTRITVDQAILGLVTKSANDAAAALGELLGGTEERFARMMTLRAKALGMSRTVFQNASGLPDPEQVTTARDMAILARRLIGDFPAFYGYFSTPTFVWQHRVIYNHDRMLYTYPGADGLKTGYTHASGYNLVTSATRGGVRLIGVVLGAASSGERATHMASLLNAGFDRLDVPTDRRNTQVAIQTPSRFTLVSSAQAAPRVETPRPPPEPAKVSPRPRAPAPTWAIQVGSFATERAARDAAASGRKAAEGGEAGVEAATVNRQTVWRAKVTNLSATDAQSACVTLAKRKVPCLIQKPDMRQVASR